MHGTPLGRRDPKGVFRVVETDGVPTLRISGEIYGGLTTRAEYGNYRLRLSYLWGEKIYAPRLTRPRDGGILFHATGRNEDANWSVFLPSLECQISGVRPATFCS